MRNIPAMQPLSIQSYLRFPLTRLLANGGAVRILRGLFLYGGPLSVTQLSHETGITPQGVRLALCNLIGQQIVTEMGRARSMLYQANMKHPMASSLNTLFADEKAHWESILRSLRSSIGAIDSVEAAWYYGSVARAEDRPDSDLDIAIVVSGELDATVEVVREALRFVESSYAITCSVAGVNISEVTRMAEENAWWKEVARDAQVIKGVLPDRLVRQLAVSATKRSA